jgi:hypothetical protein
VTKQEKRERDLEKQSKMFKVFGETNTAISFAKYILAASWTRTAQVKKVSLVLQDGAEFELDCRDNKTFKKFMKKIKERK